MERVDFSGPGAYLVASMKRLLALAALLLGLSALVAPAHARLYPVADSSALTCAEKGNCGVQVARAEADAAQPRSSRKKTVRPMGASGSSAPRTVILPVVMLADRPLE